MALKVNFLFNAGSNGWTETYYHSSDDPYTTVTGFLTSQLQPLVTFRAPLTYLYGVRASVVGGQKKSYSRLLPSIFYGLAKESIITPATADVSSTDAVLKLVGSGRHVRRVFLRGLASIDVKRDANGVDKPSGNLIAGFDNMLTQLVAMGLQIQYQQQPGGVGPVKYRAFGIRKSVSFPALSEISIGADAFAALTVGDHLIFQRTQRGVLPGFPRNAKVVQKIDDTDGKWIAVDYIAPITGRVWFPNWYFFKYVPQYDPIQYYNFERFSERKTGRPIGLLRGKSSGTKRPQYVPVAV